MSDIAAESSKPAKPPSLISLSFGGFNSIAIVTSSISILRLITAHSTITLHGIVADVIDWYKKFFHQSFDVAIEWVNAFHIHWLHLPHISDNMKDAAIITLLAYFVMLRSVNNMYSRSATPKRWYLKYFSPFHFVFSFILQAILGKFDKNYHPMNFSLAKAIAIEFTKALFLQLITTSFAVGSMLILSAYS